jgi:hypothetical protein
MFGLGVERSGAALSAFLDVWLERLRSGAAPVRVLSVNIRLICGIVRLLEIDRTCPLALVPSPLHLSLSIGRPLQALGMDAELSCARAQHTKVLKASATATDGICWPPPPPTAAMRAVGAPTLLVWRSVRHLAPPSNRRPHPLRTPLSSPTSLLLPVTAMDGGEVELRPWSRARMGPRWSSSHGCGPSHRVPWPWCSGVFFSLTCGPHLSVAMTDA